MIECVFTLDYEIYGNGTGALADLVYEPANRLIEIFRKWDARFVAFLEVAELEKIEEFGTDAAIELVRAQIEELYNDAFEIGLHLHPQWYNARREGGSWVLDPAEYNLCRLPRERIAEIVARSLDYLRYVVGQRKFTPLSFRAGNWLFQPTATAAEVLLERGIKIDSSVFKGGLQHSHNLDYRAALKNGYYWRFTSDANKADGNGPWLEFPIYTEMVPVWRMATSKRVGFANSGSFGGRGWSGKANRLRDLMRFRYPRKFDFCRMTFDELKTMLERVIREDKEQPEVYRPLVAIGHTKDLTDPGTVDRLLAFLKAQQISVTTFEAIYPKVRQEVEQIA